LRLIFEPIFEGDKEINDRIPGGSHSRLREY
jgi:hypothetical protein